MATAILIILDGLGVGKAPDAEKYGDVGSDTLGNMSRQVGGLNVPTLQQLGLGNLSEIKGVPAIQSQWATMVDYKKLVRAKIPLRAIGN